MPAYKDKERGTWYASFYYMDWSGQRKLKKKRGFARKKDAEDFEREFLRKGARSSDMAFSSMVELYLEDMRPRLRESTMRGKEYMIERHVLPFFKDLPINEITPAHIRRWQAGLLAGNFSQTYLKNVNNQVSAIFNYACRYYGLPENPARLAGSIGRSRADGMKFWTVEQFNTFIVAVPNFSAKVGLSVLFWTGLRIGELLALTRADVDLDAGTIYVSKSFQSFDGREIVTEPKTPKSRRVVPMPAKLRDLMRQYIEALYEPQPGDRLFPYTKSSFSRWMSKGCEASGVERIRLHDLRHSHASLLINLGSPILLVSERLGHEDIQTTLQTYGHLYNKTTDEALQKLDDLML